MGVFGRPVRPLDRQPAILDEPLRGTVSRSQRLARTICALKSFSCGGGGVGSGGAGLVFGMGAAIHRLGVLAAVLGNPALERAALHIEEPRHLIDPERERELHEILPGFLGVPRDAARTMARRLRESPMIPIHARLPPLTRRLDALR